MDFSENCILLYDKKLGGIVDKTTDIKTITLNKEDNTYTIKFSNSSHTYRYNFFNVQWLTDPVSLDVKKYLVYIRGKIQNKVQTLLRFENQFHIEYEDGSYRSVSIENLNLVYDHKEDKEYKNFIHYLLDVTSSIDAPGNLIEEEGFLHKELREMPIFEDSVLSDFISNKAIRKRREKNESLLLPFQANKSQIQAIRNALTHNISIIQGPPGTGKTQTIINLIANLIYQGKTVAVVSGNNEAINNIYEKLENASLGFFGAFLGNKENTTKFFSESHEMPKLDVKFTSSDGARFNESFATIQRIYEAQEQSAKIQNQLFELKAEYKNFTRQYQPGPNLKLAQGTRKNLLSRLRFLQGLVNKGNVSLLDKIRMFFLFPFQDRKSILQNLGSVLADLQEAFYRSEIEELNKKQRKLQDYLRKVNIEATTKVLQETSRKLLLTGLKERFSQKDFKFTQKNYRYRFDSFLQRFPLVYSTTNSLHYCSQKDYRYDYVLVDESSQINIATASIAMACAKNIVFVGDPMQLPHIVRTIERPVLKDIFDKYSLPQYENYEKYSILDVIRLKYGDALPFTLLNIHYRSDPEIIGFCNKMFYDGKLIINRKHEEGNGIRIITHDGHYCVHRSNEREVDIIRKEVLPNLKTKDIGIIAPYRNQVRLLTEELANPDLTVDTVHKFQGKERDAIILSATSDKLRIQAGEERTDFLNDPNLINVAISRARNLLYVVGSKLLFEEKDILSSLRDYVLYYSDYKQSTIEESKARSVFDLLYKNGIYDPDNIKLKLRQFSEFQSENLIATLLDMLKKQYKANMFDYLHNYPLRLLLNADSFEDIEDRKFISNPFSHVDFLIYSPIGKRPLFVIEVDGKQHQLAQQSERDKRKDRILSSVGLKVLRLKTTDSDCKDKIKQYLSSN